jgi:hypothetical protein
MTARIGLPVLVSLLLVGGPAAADRGTHFVIEIEGGLASSSADHLDLGWSFGGTVGIGGKLRGFPPRFYAIGTYRSSLFSGEGLHYATRQPYDAWEANHELTGGLRVVFPLWSRVFRLVTEVRGGSVAHTATLDRPGAPKLQSTSWQGVLVLGAGLQARWHPNAAVGIAFEWAHADRGVDLVARAAGHVGTGDDRLSLYVSNTWFF